MITTAHKTLLLGIVIGMIAVYIWHRRAGGSSPEGG